VSEERGSRRSGILYVVGTPIGNLDDITIRAIDVLKQVAVIAAEDTRTTAKLLARHGIATKCVSFREQNSARAIPPLLEQLAEGCDVAVVSDAGTPSISDPGDALVAAAAREGFHVSPIPGASALASAISVAALEGDGVRFAGFLPRSGKDRRKRIEAISADPSCTVVYESPRRIGETLEELAATCPGREAVLCRELTKIHEEIARGPLEDLATRFSGDVKGEITLVIGGNRESAGEIDDERLRALVEERVRAGKSAKDVAAALSAALGVKKKRIYQMAVEALGQRDE